MMSNVQAADVAQSTAGGTASSFIMLLGFLLIFYFLIWRPQSKRAKEQRELISGLSVGDEAVTASGLLGEVAKITDNFVVLRVADDMQINVQKNAIASLVPKGTMKSI